MAHNDDTVVALDDTDIRLLLAQADVLDQSRKAAAEAFDKVADEIRTLLGEATVGTVDGVEVVTNRWQNRATTDVKALRALFPDAAAAVLGSSRFRKLDRKPKHAAKGK